MSELRPPELRLSHLVVRRLRNVDVAELDLARGQNLLVGGNGQGKTTLLEATYLLGAIRSFRGGRSRELIQHGEDLSAIEGKLVGAEPESEVSMTLERRGGRRIRVDGKRAELSTHFRRFPMVAFHPGDLDLVLGAPADRRRFLDRMLFQAVAGYASWHREYARALRSRNELLRRKAPEAQIRAFDGILASRGASIGEARTRLVDVLREATEDILEELGIPAFGAHLQAKVEPTVERLMSALEASLPMDRARRRTTVGPHTDDLVLEKREGRAREVASRGEARALAVALRLAERRVVTEEAGSQPVLLLDDVAAELDRHRTERVVSMVTRQGGQVVVSATGAAEDHFGSGWRRFEIRKGAIASVEDR